MHNFSILDQSHLDHLAGILDKDGFLVSEEDRRKYGQDETEDLVHPPAVVLRPTDKEQVSAILAYCHEHAIPVTPSGARTGLSGGALPILGGVALSTERMNRIVEIDDRNLQVRTQPGVITQVLQEEVEARGLFYPPDPASRGSCFIGGNVAENSGGPRALKYGVTKDYVLDLELVLPSGEVIRTGAPVLKNSTGYNLTQLVVGSEGTLGVVTEIVLRLVPKPKMDLLILVDFDSPERACELVGEVFRRGYTPSVMEFMERDAILYAVDTLNIENFSLPDAVGAQLLIGCDGNQMDPIMNDIEAIVSVCEEYGAGEILFAESNADKDRLWNIRRKIGEAVKAFSIYKEEDTVVPRAELPRLLAGVKEVGSRHGFKSVCYGHAGDGNLHVNILKGELSDDQWENNLPIAIREIFELTVSLGGTISGEHGIGLVQKGFMDIAFNRIQLQLMRDIKSVFDPKGIMNPGKIFPDQGAIAE